MSLVLLLAAAAALGRLAGRLLPMGNGIEGWVFRLSAGLSGCAVLALAAGAQSLLAAQMLLFGVIGAGLLGEAAGWVYDRPVRRGGQNAVRPKEPALLPGSLGGATGWICVLMAALALAMAFFSAWAPASEPASTGGMLMLAKGHALAGDMRFQEHLSGSGGPPLMTALYAVAFYGSGERPAVLLGWIMGLLACAAAYALGKRVAGPRAGAAAAAVFATMPVFFDQAATASTGMAAALFVMASMTAVLAWLDEGDPGRLALAGWMAGSAVGVSHGCAVLVLAMPLVALLGHGAGLPATGFGMRLRGAAGLAAATALGACPFLLFAALTTGDPVYPWFQAIFPAHTGARPAVATLSADPALLRDGFRWSEFLRYPWDVVMRPLRFDGWAHSPGGVIAAMVLPGLLFGGRRVWLITAVAVPSVMTLWFVHRGALAALPCFALMTPVCGAALERLPKWRGAAAVALLAGCLFGLGLHGLRLKDQVPVLTGSETRDAYLARRAPGFAAWDAVNRRAARVTGARVLVLDDSAYFAEVPVYANREGLRVLARLQGRDQLDWLKQRQIGLVVLPESLLGEDAPLAPEVREMAAFWKANTAVFPLAESLDLPRVAAEGVERVDVLAFTPLP